MITPLFTYWEGPKKEWIHLCIESVKQSCTGVEFNLITPENASRFLGNDGLIPEFSELDTPAHRSDYLRAMILAKHGGYYFDADTIGFKCPSNIPESDLTYCTWTNQPRRVLNGYLYARKGSDIILEWRDKVVETLRTNKRRSWAALGEEILTPLTEKYKPATKEIPLSTVLPVDIDAYPERVFSHHPFQESMTEHSVCFGLNNSRMSHFYPEEVNLPSSEWDQCLCLFHQLLCEARNRVTNSLS